MMDGRPGPCASRTADGKKLDAADDDADKERLPLDAVDDEPEAPSGHVRLANR